MYIFQVDSVVVDQGERYDMILEANQETAFNYWIRMNGHSRCARTEAHQTAILRYQGAADMFPTAPDDYANGERSGVVRFCCILKEIMIIFHIILMPYI